MDHKMTIISEGEIESILKKTIKNAVENSYEELQNSVISNQYLTKERLIEMTGWSERTIQNLRDTRQIPFSQHGRKILYPYSGIVNFLEKNIVLPKSKGVQS